MAMQTDTHAVTTSTQPPESDGVDNEPSGVLLGSWTAAREITAYRQADADPEVEPDAADQDDAEINIFGPQAGLWNKISAYRARRRLNRRFRRNQREFDNVMDGLADDPAAQRELKTIWTIGH